MKLPVDKKHAAIAGHAFLVIVLSAACILCMMHLGAVKGWLKNVLNILSPFILGAVIAYILNPVLKASERLLNLISRGKMSRRVKRSLGLLMSYIFAFVVLGILVWIILPQIIESITNLIPQVYNWFKAFPTILNDLAIKYDLDLEMLTQTETLTKILGKLETYITNLISDLTSLIPQVFQLTTSVIGQFLDIIIGVIVSIYLLSSKELFYAHVKKFCYAILPGKVVDKLIEITHTSNYIFNGFIVGKIIDSAIIGVICYIVMTLFKWPYATLISVIIGITNIIPYFGPFIGAIPSILLLLIIDPYAAIKFTVFIIILQQVDGNIIGPKILGDTTGLSAFWVVFSITLFSALMGPVGMIIGVPTFAVIYALVREFSEWRLQRKKLATATSSYASPDNPIIQKAKSPPHTVPLTEAEMAPHEAEEKKPDQPEK